MFTATKKINSGTTKEFKVILGRRREILLFYFHTVVSMGHWSRPFFGGAPIFGGLKFSKVEQIVGCIPIFAFNNALRLWQLWDHINDCESHQ